MSWSLPTQDPSRLGPYQLTGRLAETPAGIVYGGVDPHGRQITLAVLNQGAAGDAAARDRFRAAILAEPLYTEPPAGTAAIVGAEPDGPTPWVATLHEPGARGAERFLAAVVLTGPPRGPAAAAAGGPSARPAARRRGPLFQPHWLGSRDPALTPAGSGRDPARDRGIIATVMTVAALLVLVALLLLLLFACQPDPPPPPRPSPSPASPTPTRSTQSPSPSPTPLSPSPTRKGSRSPSPSETGGSGAPGDSL